MRRVDTALSGVCILEPEIHHDERGSFFESYHRQKFEALGINDCFVQDNHSVSVRGVLRGLHYQLRKPQAKLCRVVVGAVLDVAVDLRRESPHFGGWTSTLLSAQNRRQLYIPAGFAHGFVVLTETAEFLYKCSDFYQPGDERGVAWNDPDLAIDWQLESPPVLSPKDARNPSLAELGPADLPSYSSGAENDPQGS